jgi:carbamate kinase
VALGGNARSPRGVETAVRALAELAVERTLVVTCRDGPWAGRLEAVLAAAGLGLVRVGDDLSAALLGERLGARSLLLLTGVAAVERGWGTAHAAPIGRTTPEELRRLDFAPGSMGAKVEAACHFVERTGGTAAIGSLDTAAAVARGEAGTQITLPGLAGDLGAHFG